jgi:hypothetical protein
MAFPSACLIGKCPLCNGELKASLCCERVAPPAKGAYWTKEKSLTRTTRTGARPVLPNRPHELDRSAIDGQPDSRQSQKMSSPLDRFSVSISPQHNPRLHGLFFGLRSFVRHIRSLWKQDGIRAIEIGSAFQVDAQQCLVRNKRTQAHSADIQKLRSDFRAGLSFGDCDRSLGDAAEELHRSCDIEGSGEGRGAETFI